MWASRMSTRIQIHLGCQIRAGMKYVVQVNSQLWKDWGMVKYWCELAWIGFLDQYICNKLKEMFAVFSKSVPECKWDETNPLFPLSCLLHLLLSVRSLIIILFNRIICSKLFEALLNKLFFWNIFLVEKQCCKGSV